MRDQQIRLTLIKNESRQVIGCLCIGHHEYHAFKKELCEIFHDRYVDSLVISQVFVLQKGSGWEISESRKGDEWEPCTIAETLDVYLDRVTREQNEQ